MNLSDQCCSLELAKKLKELGVKGEDYSAFTIAELLQLLPNRITLKEGEPYNSFCFSMNKSFIVEGMHSAETLKTTDNYIVNYVCDSTSEEINYFFEPLTRNICDENPANALAMMLVHLIENGLHNAKT